MASAVESFLNAAQANPSAVGGARNFASDITKFAKKARINLDLAHRKVCLDLFTSLVKKSPVDTGRFRSNWQIGVNAINLLTDESTDKSGGQATLRAFAAMAEVKAGGTVYLTNSLPYAISLEYGWSKQAPQGMVRLSLAEYSSAMRRVLGA
jgi:hypothetical protein